MRRTSVSIPERKELTVHIAILTFDGYNELDSLIALGVLNRVSRSGWRVSIAAPSPRVRSMNGVVIESMASLEEACEADAVVVGSGTQTREVIADPAIMGPLGRLDPARQLLAGQCSGTLVLARLGLLEDVARGNVATAGGCLASHYLAAWIIARLEGDDAAERALHYVAPVGEKEDYVARALRNITPYLAVPSGLS
jgi:putative intracellular protease/amidase